MSLLINLSAVVHRNCNPLHWLHCVYKTTRFRNLNFKLLIKLFCIFRDVIRFRAANIATFSILASLFTHIRYDLNKMCHVNEEEWCSHSSWHPFRRSEERRRRVFGMISRNLKMTTAVRQRVLRAFCCAWYSIIDKAFSPPKGTYWKLSSSAQAVSTAPSSPTAIKNSSEWGKSWVCVRSWFPIKLLWHVTVGAATPMAEHSGLKKHFRQAFCHFRANCQQIFMKALLFCGSCSTSNEAWITLNSFPIRLQ